MYWGFYLNEIIVLFLYSNALYHGNKRQIMNEGKIIVADIEPC